MWKVAVVQPVDRGLWLQYHHRNQRAARLVRIRDARRSRSGRNPCSGGFRESRFGTSTLQPAASAPMVGRFIGFVEQMKAARPARGTRVDRKIGDRPSPIDPEGQINPNESATANKPEIAAASIKS